MRSDRVRKWGEVLFLVVVITLVALLTLAELLAGDRLTVNRLTNIQAGILYSVTGRFLVPLVALAVPFSIYDASEMPFWIGFAAFLGFGGLAGAAAGIAQVLFIVFLVFALIALVFGRGAPTV